MSGFRGNLEELLEWELPVHSGHHSAHSNALSLPVLPGNTLGQLAWALVFHVEPTCDRWLDPGMYLVGSWRAPTRSGGREWKDSENSTKVFIVAYLCLDEGGCLSRAQPPVPHS